MRTGRKAGKRRRGEQEATHVVEASAQGSGLRDEHRRLESGIVPAPVVEASEQGLDHCYGLRAAEREVAGTMDVHLSQQVVVAPGFDRSRVGGLVLRDD